MTNPLGKRTTTVYDIAGRTLALVDPLSNRTTFGYDAASRQSASRTPWATSRLRSTIGQPAHGIRDAMNLRTTQVYDAASRMITAPVDANNHRTTFQYDAAAEYSRNRPLVAADDFFLHRNRAKGFAVGREAKPHHLFLRSGQSADRPELSVASRSCQ